MQDNNKEDKGSKENKKDWQTEDEEEEGATAMYEHWGPIRGSPPVSRSPTPENDMDIDGAQYTLPSHMHAEKRFRANPTIVKYLDPQAGKTLPHRAAKPTYAAYQEMFPQSDISLHHAAGILHFGPKHAVQLLPRSQNSRPLMV